MLTWRRGLGATVDDLAQAIARFEGFYNTTSNPSQRDNNPGNLRSGPGQTGTDSAGYAIFPDVATGYAALDNQINLNVSRGLSLDQFFAGEPGVYKGYAPAADSNNPAQYATTVAGWIGIDPTVPLTQALGTSGSVADVFSGCPVGSTMDSGVCTALSPVSSASNTSDLSDTGDSGASSDIFGELDLAGTTGLSWGAGAALALGLIIVAMAFRR